MEPPARIPLASVTVSCSVCGGNATAREINDDRMRYHLQNGAMIRLPEHGLTEDERAELNTMFLRCELCQEDCEEEEGCC